MEFQQFDISRIPSGEKGTGWLEVAPRADGGTWRLPLIYVSGASGGPKLVVTAGVHGNEYEGVEAIPRIYEQVNPMHCTAPWSWFPYATCPHTRLVLETAL